MKILVPASPRLGVNAVTGEGLAHAAAGVDTVVRGMDDFIRALFNATGDPRSVLTDPDARYFGAVLDEHSIVRARAESNHPLRHPVRRVARVPGAKRCFLAVDRTVSPRLRSWL